MAEVLVPNVWKLVAQMVNGTETWTNSIHIKKTADAPLDDTEAPVLDFAALMVQNVSNNAFVETITGYPTYQRKKGETNVEHPPLFIKTIHTAGTRNAAYGAGTPHGDPLPKDVVIYATLDTSGGRKGKIFYRNNLWEGEVISVEAGRWQFNTADDRFTPARYITTVTTAMQDIMPGGSNFSSHQWVVAHLLLVKATDTRAAYTTNVTGSRAIRPTWNDAHR